MRRPAGWERRRPWAGRCLLGRKCSWSRRRWLAALPRRWASVAGAVPGCTHRPRRLLGSLESKHSLCRVSPAALGPGSGQQEPHRRWCCYLAMKPRCLRGAGGRSPRFFHLYVLHESHLLPSWETTPSSTSVSPHLSASPPHPPFAPSGPLTCADLGAYQDNPPYSCTMNLEFEMGLSQGLSCISKDTGPHPDPPGGQSVAAAGS